MYTVCSKTPEQENLVQQTTVCVCTGFTSGGYLASPRPLEASYPKYLVSSEDSLEPSRGQEKRPPLRPHLGEIPETGPFFPGPFSHPLLFFSSMFVGGEQFLF